MTRNVPGRARRAASQQSSTSNSVVRVHDLGVLIKEKRAADGLTLEQAAAQCGVSVATLWRWERQQRPGSPLLPSVPDTRTLTAITRWLGVALDRVLDMPTSAPTHAVPHHESDSVPDIVAAHLRADKNLDRATAEALARVFRATYEEFTPDAMIGSGTAQAGVDGAESATKTSGKGEPDGER